MSNIITHPSPRNYKGLTFVNAIFYQFFAIFFSSEKRFIFVTMMGAYDGAEVWELAGADLGGSRCSSSCMSKSFANKIC